MKQRFFSLLSFILLFIINNTSFSQTFAWAQNVGSSNNAGLLVNSMAVDASGNVYSIGLLSGAADFDPSATVVSLTGNTVGHDVFIQKLDPAGNLLWAKLLSSGNSFTQAYKLKLDNSNNVYVVGSFDETVDFDPGTALNNISPMGGQDAFILKLNSSGDFIWVKTLGGMNANVSAEAIAIDNNNDVVIAGLYSDFVDFDPGPNVVYLPTILLQAPFILKLNSTGNFIWVKALQSNNFANAASLEVDPSNNIYCTGNYMGSIDLDPSTATSNFTASTNMLTAYLVKLNSIGNYVYGKSFGGNEDVILQDIKRDNANNLYISGEFYGTCDFNPDLAANNLSTVAGNRDGFILKLDNAGNFLWVKNFGGLDDVFVKDIDIDNLGNVYSTGYFYGEADFDPSAGTTSFIPSGMSDIFMSKLSTSGNFIWAHQIGTTSDDIGFAIEIDSSYDIYSIGVFNGLVDFDPLPSVNTITAPGTSGVGSLYCFKWDQCTPSTSSMNASGCTYTLNSQTYSGNGTYTQILPNSVGCDSVITLTLTSSTSNTTLSPTSCSGSYTYNGQTYIASGTYTQAYTNASGCDSNTIINLTMGSATFSSTTISACDFYFSNGTFYNSSGVYMDTLINAIGCDSIVTLNLTINPTYNNSVLVNTCGPYTFNGVTYNTSGFYTGNFTTVFGCDSTIDLLLTITPLPNTIITQSTCTSYTLNGQTYTATGNYTQQFVSANGCDSFVVLNLTVNVPNINMTQSGVTLTSSATAPSTYQWIQCNPYSIITGANAQSYTATSNGDYAVVVTLNGCKDTSACKTLTGVDIDENYLSNFATIYPNPVEDILNIEFDQNIKNLNLKLMSMTGQVLYENNYSNTNGKKIPTHNLSQGLYILYLNDGTHRANIKFNKK